MSLFFSFLDLKLIIKYVHGSVFQAIFQRYPRPEKEYQSFSLIYGDRSLDLVRLGLFGNCFRKQLIYF